MKYKMTFPERYAAILICNALKSTNAKEWRIVEAAKEKIKITDQEKEDLKVRVVSNMITFDKEKAEQCVTEYDLDEQFISFLKRQVTAMNEQNALAREVLPLADRFEIE